MGQDRSKSSFARLCSDSNLLLSGDAFCAGEMRRQYLSGSVQRRGRFVEDRVIGLDVGHPRGDVERDLDVGRLFQGLFALEGQDPKRAVEEEPVRPRRASSDQITEELGSDKRRKRMTAIEETAKLSGGV